MGLGERRGRAVRPGWRRGRRSLSSRGRRHAARDERCVSSVASNAPGPEGVVMGMRRSPAVLLASFFAAAALAAPAWGADVRVTRDDTPGSYLRSDGGTDATMLSCSTGRRTQNEPSVAVDPRNASIVVAGSNDYCAEIQNGPGNVWAGYYRSTDGGATWSNSLAPGYPADSSAAGTASPTHGSCAAAGDPTQAFDG